MDGDVQRSWCKFCRPVFRSQHQALSPRNHHLLGECALIAPHGAAEFELSHWVVLRRTGHLLLGRRACHHTGSAVAKSLIERFLLRDDLECPLREPGSLFALVLSVPPTPRLFVDGAPKFAGFPGSAPMPTVGSAKGAAAPCQRRAPPRSRSGGPRAHKPAQGTRCRHTRRQFFGGPSSLAR